MSMHVASVKKNVIANYIGQGWRTLMGLAFIPLYIKHLGMEAYGLIGSFFVLQAWLGLLDMGIRPALGREMARFTAGSHNSQSIRDLLRSTEIIVVGIAALVSAGIWIGSSWLATHWVIAAKLPSQNVSNAFTLMGLVVALSFVESVYVSTLAGLQRQVIQNVAGSLIATVRAIGAVAVLAWISPSIEAFFIWQGLVSSASVLVFSTIVHKSIPPAPRPSRFSRNSVVEVWQFAARTTAITFLALLLTQVDKILLSRVLPLADFGNYALAALVANGLYVLATPVTAAIYPRFTELVTRCDEPALRAMYHQGAQLVTVLMGSAAIALIVFGTQALSLWTSDPILTKQVSPLLAVMALGTLLNGLMWIPHQLQLAYGWTSLAIKTNLIAVATLIPAILWVAPRFGGIGTAWVWVALNSGYVLIAIYFMHRRLLPAEKWRWYISDVSLPLLAASSAAVLCRHWIPIGDTKLTELASLVICGFLILSSAVVAAPLVRREVGSQIAFRLRLLLAGRSIGRK